MFSSMPREKKQILSVIADWQKKLKMNNPQDAAFNSILLHVMSTALQEHMDEVQPVFSALKFLSTITISQSSSAHFFSSSKELKIMSLRDYLIHGHAGVYHGIKDVVISPESKLPTMSVEHSKKLIELYNMLEKSVFAWHHSYLPDMTGQIKNQAIGEWQVRMMRDDHSTSENDFARNFRILGEKWIRKDGELALHAMIDSLVHKELDYPGEVDRQLFFDWIKSSRGGQRIMGFLNHMLAQKELGSSYTLSYCDSQLDNWGVKSGKICYETEIHVLCLQESETNRLLVSSLGNKQNYFTNTTDVKKQYKEGRLKPLLLIRAEVSLNVEKNKETSNWEITPNVTRLEVDCCIYLLSRPRITHQPEQRTFKP